MNKDQLTTRAIGRLQTTTPSTTPKKGSNLGKRKEPNIPTIDDVDYVSLLTNRPSDSSKESQPTQAVDLTSEDIIEPDQMSLTKVTKVIDLEDPKEVWEHALTLASEGKVEESTVYFHIHAQMKKTNKLVNNNNNELQIDKTTSQRDSSVSNPHNVITEGGLSFIPGAITSHTDIGFTPYFDRNLRELRGPIPLTIFNKQWQELANSYHVEKRVKTDNLNKDITTYTGYPYPHEMTQSYATWNVNYRNFVSVLRDVYNFKTFATWAEAHQANVKFYHERDNWMTAFRYDIKIRLNAFAFRVSENGLTVTPDISQRRENVAALCFAEARRLEEGAFTDNPYAKGGVRFGFDWTTGLPRNSANNGNNQSNSVYGAPTSNETTNAQSSFSNNRAGSNQYTSNNNRKTHNQSSDNGNANGRARGGYNGKNYDPNFAAKKAASNAKQAQGSNGS